MLVIVRRAGLVVGSLIVDHLGCVRAELPEPSYQELAALVAGLAARVETLETENAELRRRLGLNSANSSSPPSKDSIEAKAKRRADRSSRERSTERKPGGQPGHKEPTQVDHLGREISDGQCFAQGE